MKIYCSGIGGIGLSAYAALQNANGHTVMGSDRADSPLVQDLRSQGIEVFLEQDANHIPSDCDLFVYSVAIPEDAPERVQAAEYGIRQLSYFGAVGELSKGYQLIAVCGTHGKSSTTAMAARMLIELEFDPTVIVGTKIHELDGRNWRKGGSSIFLVEACEYRHSFHFLHPEIVLMTSVDGDHYDFYGTIEKYQQAYVDFLKQLSDDGLIITHGNDAECVRVAERSGREFVSADQLELPRLSTPGRHMQENAQLALKLGLEFGIDESKAREALSGFVGSWRRMEVKGEFGDGITVIDDYGHHPAEVKATLDALKEAYSGRRLICVFQPHTHERTLSFFDEFTVAFSSADIVLLADVYEARSDIERERADIAELADAIASKSSTECHAVGPLDVLETRLSEIAQPRDVIVCMGAGTITNLASVLVS